MGDNSDGTKRKARWSKWEKVEWRERASWESICVACVLKGQVTTAQMGTNGNTESVQGKESELILSG